MLTACCKTGFLSILRSLSTVHTAIGICNTGYAAVSITCMTYTYCCVFSTKTPEDGQKTCPKHVEFYSKNKFEKLVHLVGFII